MSAFLRDLDESNASLGNHLRKLTDPELNVAWLSAELVGVLSDLRDLGEWLRSETATRDRLPVHQQLLEYRAKLEQLRNVMCALHSRLLTERSRLQAERTHLNTASEWARASRKTYY
ncbi:MAG TPA: hypothetical protein VFA89_10175 [Terriglobales bacterium]|nr:hypothetical protein [Terriglobales bacterium]